MLTGAEVAEVVADLTYKPQWAFEVYEDRFEGLHVAIRTELEDAFHPGQPVVLNIRSPLPPFRDVEAVLDWFLWRLARIEVHEVREWTRWRGTQVSNPHVT